MNEETIIEKDWTTKAGLRAIVLCLVWDGLKHHRCGYVAVGEGNPFYGSSYDEAYEADPSLSVHGGLSYSQSDEGGNSICGHQPPPIPKDTEGHYWWFGFDCAHAQDGVIEPGRFDHDRGEVRTLDYCIAECEQLARQLQGLSRQ